MAHPVVVVDDESDLLDVLRDCLEEEGFADTPMIAMSASPEVLQDAARSGLFQETIGKPFDLQELIDVMHGLLD